jgi:hypothetical protein
LFEGHHWLKLEYDTGMKCWVYVVITVFQGYTDMHSCNKFSIYWELNEQQKLQKIVFSEKKLKCLMNDVVDMLHFLSQGLLTLRLSVLPAEVCNVKWELYNGIIFVLKSSCHFAHSEVAVFSEWEDCMLLLTVMITVSLSSERIFQMPSYGLWSSCYFINYVLHNYRLCYLSTIWINYSNIPTCTYTTVIMIGSSLLPQLPNGRGPWIERMTYHHSQFWKHNFHIGGVDCHGWLMRKCDRFQRKEVILGTFCMHNQYDTFKCMDYLQTCSRMWLG